MMIGSLGPITFNVSSEKIQTFESLSRNNSSRISTHDNLQNKPILEFIGPGLDKVSLKLSWSIENKINPLSEINKLISLRDNGEVISFILGNKPYGSGKYLIESIDEEHKRIDNKGNILSISFSINLIEYIINLKKVTKIVKAPKAKPKPISNKKGSKSSKSKKKKKTTKNTGKKSTKKNTQKKTYVKKKYLPTDKYKSDPLLDVYPFLRGHGDKTKGPVKR